MEKKTPKTVKQMIAIVCETHPWYKQHDHRNSLIRGIWRKFGMHVEAETILRELRNMKDFL